MARELNLTTQKQEFIKESYLKEMHTRINWWQHYRKNLQPAPRVKPEVNVRDDIKLPAITGPSFQAKVDHKNCLDIRSVQNLRDGRWSDQMEMSPTESEMKPVSPATQSLLYHGTSKEGKGRYQYLKIRNSLGPEEKYCYPIATSWIYGWHLGNLIDNGCPQYRRCRIVSDTFYRKNGILAQPNRTDTTL